MFQFGGCVCTMWSDFVFFGFCSLVIGGPLASASSIRIVGGQDADIKNYPYQVSILYDNQHGCGGSIIANRFILTAAHCFVEERRPAHITVRVGSTYRTSGGVIFKTLKITTHTSFNPDTYDYDVAIVQLATPLTFGTGVQPIKLAASGSSESNGQISSVTGWGLTSEQGDLANTLQVVTIPVISTSTCQSNYYGSVVTSRMFCAGSAGKDSCIGDSGGPLVSNGVQVGIVSWGVTCGDAATPGVYTRITQFLTWINGVIATK